jgi:hypothetical protein
MAARRLVHPNRPGRTDERKLPDYQIVCHDALAHNVCLWRRKQLKCAAQFTLATGRNFLGSRSEDTPALTVSRTLPRRHPPDGRRSSWCRNERLTEQGVCSERGPGSGALRLGLRSTSIGGHPRRIEREAARAMTRATGLPPAGSSSQLDSRRRASRTAARVSLLARCASPACIASATRCICSRSSCSDWI